MCMYIIYMYVRIYVYTVCMHNCMYICIEFYVCMIVHVYSVYI